MKISNARLSKFYLLISFSMLSLSAMAAAPELSRNLVEAKLGRVFMSDAQRQTLDRLRRAPIANSDAAPQVGENEAPVASDAGKTTSSSGFILPSKGLPYHWKDGEFRETTNGKLRDKQPSVGITIIRHEQVPPASGASDEPLPDVTKRESPADRVEEQTNPSSKVTGDEQR